MPAASSQPKAPATRAAQAVAQRRAAPTRRRLVVVSSGYLLPGAGFAGRVHSVFAQACNLSWGNSLVTLGNSRLADGPTTLRLAEGPAIDLRELFDVGEPVICRGGLARTRDVDLDLQQAQVWRPADPRPLQAREPIEAALRRAARVLAHWRCDHRSVIDAEAAPVAASLGAACAAFDIDTALRQAERLIGWGEGLTPAGDDFLVGLIAGLDALLQDDARRQDFRDRLSLALSANAQRTTMIAAHGLRLAAQGHCGAPLHELRDALLSEPRAGLVETRLRRALAIGASSGADMVSGLLVGLTAWLPTASAKATA